MKLLKEKQMRGKALVVGLWMVSLPLSSCTSKKPSKMSISSKSFSVVAEGDEIKLFTLRNVKGTEIEIINYGAIVRALRVHDRNGELADVVLGYDTIGDYIDDNSYFGATVGRMGNRIADGRFNLNGEEYELAQNDNGNHLHGGIKGFNKQVWTPMITEENGIPVLTLSFLSVDGEEGYPGNLSIKVAYSLTQENELKIEYEATTDQPTILNPTHHSYFNLAGAGQGDILGHELWINADRFTPVREGLIPTGELRDVTGTPMDFRNPTKIGARINDRNNQLNLGLGYDHNWVLNDWDGSLQLVVSLHEPVSGRFMEVLTTEPGMQFYSGNFLDGSISGKGGKVYDYRSALCLEADHFPDSPNQPEFPSVRLNPGEKYKQTTIYRFSTR